MINCWREFVAACEQSCWPRSCVGQRFGGNSPMSTSMARMSGSLPVLDDAMASHPHVVNAPDAGDPASGRDAEERPEMGTGAIKSEREQVTLLDKRDKFNPSVRKPTAHILQHDADESVRSVYITQGPVRDHVVSDYGPQAGFVVLVDGGDQGLHDCLVRHQIRLLSKDGSPVPCHRFASIMRRCRPTFSNRSVPPAAGSTMARDHPLTFWPERTPLQRSSSP